MIERKFLRVQQRPEQIAEHLVLAAVAERLTNGGTLFSDGRCDSVARKISSMTSASGLLRRGAWPAGRRRSGSFAPRCAVLQVQQLRHRHVAVALAGARRHALGTAEQRQEVRSQSRIGQLTGAEADRIAGELIGHARYSGSAHRAAPRPADGARSSASRTACRSCCRAASPRRADRYAN